MKKTRLLAAVLTLILLTAAAIPALASGSDQVWYMLRGYRGGKDGCYLDDEYFNAVQVDDNAPVNARLMVMLEIEKAGDQVIILLGVAMQNGNTDEYLTGYDFTNLTFNVDGNEFYWNDMVSSNPGYNRGWRSTVPGLTLLVPEIAFFQAVKDAKDISITATVNGRRGYETFTIDDEDNCSNFKVFCREVCNNNFHNYCNLSAMNAIAQLFPMRTNMSSARYSYGQKLQVINCNSSISLRTNPDPDARRYCMIPKGEIVTFLEDAGNGFFKIEYDGWTGYASSLYLGW